MAQKSQNAKKVKDTPSAGSGSGRKKRTSAKGAQSASKKGTRNVSGAVQTDKTLLRVWQIVLFVTGLCFLVCILLPKMTGAFGARLDGFAHGICGGGALLGAILLFSGTFLLKRDEQMHVIPLKVIAGILCVAFFGVFFQFRHWEDPEFQRIGAGAGEMLRALYAEGAKGHGGGVLGGSLAYLLHYTGTVGTLLITIPVFVLLLLAFYGMTPKSFLIKVQYLYYRILERGDRFRDDVKPVIEEKRAEDAERREALSEMRRAREERRQQYEQEREEARRQAQEMRMSEKRNRRRASIDADIYDGTALTDAAEDPSSGKSADGYGEEDSTAAYRNEKKTNTPEPLSRKGEPVSESVYDRGMMPAAYDAGDHRSAEADTVPSDAQNGTDTGTAEENTAECPAEETDPAGDVIPAEGDTEPEEDDVFGLDGFFGSSDTDAVSVKRYGADEAAEDAGLSESILNVTRSVPEGCDGGAGEDSGNSGSESAAQSGAFLPKDPTPDEMLASLTAVYGEKKPAPVVPAEPEYVFPPTTLLKKDVSQGNEDLSEELQENGEKLESILRSFNVKTKIVNISRGPTITRYELQPEAGTRVRSVSNLVDDIALGLAASGVRIEAPIPGKSAIGVEVPNRNVATVYIRSLIEADAFRNAKSRLTTCLGMDVAGDPIYLDVAKMPHLLICGATGTGKSVCINSLIVSMLYKAKPDEVKMILIDPKKVELNIYSGIPHLLVPVVSDPKKAAGALHWAVNEMERRFEMIEDVGVRDIRGYNEITKNDPDREHMTQIVIIIDELADLMMTAPDDVEQSICRIAQKARAAGMHLIIGTQRPSVDVITGLIKANVPSRIAFRVSAQIDSRIVLDTGGAEKLIGRGDMLYSPVGAPKPTRVQGAFVSEEEIDEITEFLKKHAGHAAYADDVMQSIEKEAALCGQKKGARPEAETGDEDADGGDGDPMLRSAIELAVESGKISTSLIQRRLSLGYGRAAKLIDRMEELGYVSAPEGQKPRQVLITKEEYMELAMRQGENG